MSKSTKRSITNRCLFLKDAHSILMNGSAIDFNLLTDKYHVSKAFPKAMIEMGVIERVARGEYIWKVGEPNLALCKNVLKKENERAKARKLNTIDSSLISISGVIRGDELSLTPTTAPDYELTALMATVANLSQKVDQLTLQNHRKQLRIRFHSPITISFH